MAASNKYIFIDIRGSDEVLTMQFDSNKMEYQYYNIPMNMIQFNVKTIIDHLEYIETVYIVCNSGRRSKFIKEKYFKDEPRIKIDNNLSFNKFKMGKNNVVLADGSKITIWTTGTGKFNLNNMTRIVQVVLGSVMLIVSSFMIFHNLCSNNYIWIMYILMIMGMVALYSGITRSCFMSALLMNVIN